MNKWEREQCVITESNYCEGPFVPEKKDEKPKEIKSEDELFSYLDELVFYTDHFFEGVRLAKEGSLDDAEMMFRKSLEGQEEGGTWANLAKLYFQKSKQAYAKSESLLLKELELIAEDYDGKIPDEYFTEYVPESMERLVLLAFVQFGQFKIDKAQSTFLRILRLDRMNIDAWNGLGRCLQLSGRFEEARDALLIEKGLGIEENDLYQKMANDADLEAYNPQPILGPYELVLRWVGTSGDFILKIMKGLHSIHGRRLKQEDVVNQAQAQGMPRILAKDAIEKLLDEGIIYAPKIGIIVISS
jgi:tetratricopeptide (TPR) repeat protein